MKNKIFNNKRGWVKVLEVFVAILLVMGVIFFILNESVSEDTISNDIYEMEISILRNVQLNDTFRNAVLGADIPSDWNDFDSGNLNSIKSMINEKKLNNLECEAKICSLEETCISDSDVKKDIYAQAVVISASSNVYSPRQLKLFCRENEI